MTLFAFGSNGSGQLGIGHKEDVSRPTECLFDSRTGALNDDTFKSQTHNANSKTQLLLIAAGGNHTLALFGSGAVHAAGSNYNGRCAHLSSEIPELLKFSRVEFNDGERMVTQFTAVAATWESSCFVDKKTGHVYVAGVGIKGELGLGETITETSVPTRIPNFPPGDLHVLCISGSVGHMVAVLSNGEVYGWGNARKGQLGEPGAKNKIWWSPRKIEIPFLAKRVACGREFTVITGDSEDGAFIVLGSDKWAVKSDAPPNLKGYRSITASWHGIYSHNIDGSITAWGRNDRGQLPPEKLPKATLMGIGSEHGIVVLGGGEVVAFGWGEHGNCGPEVDDQGNVAGRYARIALEHNAAKSCITTVGAGCATSWIMME